MSIHQLYRRLYAYQLHVATGQCADLRDAVRREAEKRRQERDQAHTNSRGQWHEQQLAKARKRWRHHRDVVFAQGGPCVYCGDPNPSHVDHIAPRAQSGQDTLSNLTLACRWCNWEKNGRSVSEWKTWRSARGKSWPPDWSERPCHTQPTVGCPTCAPKPRTS